MNLMYLVKKVTRSKSTLDKINKRHNLQNAKRRMEVGIFSFAPMEPHQSCIQMSNDIARVVSVGRHHRSIRPPPPKIRN